MVSVAPFRFDITPPLGHALLGGLVPCAGAVDDSLEAIGYVLLNDDAPIVVCVLDWAGLMNSAHHRFCVALADAAGTSVDRVALHCVHQHNTPFVCEATRVTAAQFPDLQSLFDPVFFAACIECGASAVRGALESPQPITDVAVGHAQVHQVGSNRRVDRDEHNQVRQMRGSSCSDADLAALPEGTIDPYLRTICYFSGDQKIVSSHFYATHPMSYYRDGRVTSDFCGLARKKRQQDEPACTHLYFTGCAGNVAAGKYNDGSAAARVALTQRMYAAIIASEANLRTEPIQSIDWRHTTVTPLARAVPSVEALGATVGGPTAESVGRILRAYWQSWQQRPEPLALSCLQINGISVLHLPAELFVEYQLRAQESRPGQPVLVAAYGDGGPWYIPTESEYPAGGYETVVAFSEPSIDQQISAAIQRLLA